MRRICNPLMSRLALALSLGVAFSTLEGFAPVAQAKGLESLADLAAKVTDAVVNISAEEVIPQKAASGEIPNIAPGTPFDDLFRDFFKNRNKGQDGAPQSPPGGHGATSLGSGFVIDASGIVITDNHVIADANEITVIFTDGRKLKAKVIGKDPKIDVAVLKVESKTPLQAVPFGDSDKMRIGDPVMAVGNPFALGGTVTAGIVSARHRNIDSGPYDDYIQTDASINKGNSGGPLFNMAGEVIGINTAILSPSGGSIGLGFATPSNDVLPIISQLQKYGETRRGWLGVRIQKVDDAIADSLGLGSARGALVAGIDPKGPAGPAGLKAGDVIVKFNGQDIKESRDLPKIVASTAVGESVDVIVMRAGKEVTRKLTLGRLEEDQKLASLKKDDEGATPVNPVVEQSLGMSLVVISPELRKKFSIKDKVVGVVITGVEAGSVAASKGLVAGDVIVEVNQEAVKAPSDIAAKVKSAKESGKKSALLLVATPVGDVQFVAIATE